MADPIREDINIGLADNDGTGDTLRAASGKTNRNFKAIWDTIVIPFAEKIGLIERVQGAFIPVQTYALRDQIPVSYRRYGFRVTVVEAFTDSAGKVQPLDFVWTQNRFPDQPEGQRDGWLSVMTQADLLNRGNHTGGQPQETIFGLPQALTGLDTVDKAVQRAISTNAALQISSASIQAPSANGPFTAMWWIDGVAPATQRMEWNGWSINLDGRARRFVMQTDWTVVRQMTFLGNSMTDANDIDAGGNWSGIYAARAGVGFTNVAKYSQPANKQALRSGGKKIRLTVAGNALPAGGGTVNITAINDVAPGTDNPDSFLNTSAGDAVTVNNSITGRAAGRHMTISIPTGGSAAYRITMDAGQTAVGFAPGTIFVPDAAATMTVNEVHIDVGRINFYPLQPYLDLVASMVGQGRGNPITVWPILPADGDSATDRQRFIDANTATAATYPLLTPRVNVGGTVYDLLGYMQFRGGTAIDPYGNVPTQYHKSGDTLHFNTLGCGVRADFADLWKAQRARPPLLTFDTDVSWYADGTDGLGNSMQAYVLARPMLSRTIFDDLFDISNQYYEDTIVIGVDTAGKIFEFVRNSDGKRFGSFAISASGGLVINSAAGSTDIALSPENGLMTLEPEQYWEESTRVIINSMGNVLAFQSAPVIPTYAPIVLPDGLVTASFDGYYEGSTTITVDSTGVVIAFVPVAVASSGGSVVLPDGIVTASIDDYYEGTAQITLNTAGVVIAFMAVAVLGAGLTEVTALGLRVDSVVDAAGAPKTHLFGERFIREFPRIRDQILTDALNTTMHIAWMGDSYTEQGVWLRNLARAWKLEMGNGGPGWVGVGWPSNGTANNNVGGNVDEAEVSVTFTGSWTGQWMAADSSPDACSTTSVTAGDKININYNSTLYGAATITVMKLFWKGGTGVSRYRFNGGAWTTLNLDGADGQAVAISGIPAGNSWLFEWEHVSGTGTYHGLTMLTGSKGVVVHDLAVSGSDLYRWSGLASANPADWRAKLAAGMARLGKIASFMCPIGTNDQSYHRSYESYQAGMDAWITEVGRVANPAADIVWMCAPESGRTVAEFPERMVEFGARAKQVALARNISLIDMQPLFGATYDDYAYGNPNRELIGSDLLHPTAAGGATYRVAARNALERRT